MCVRACLCVRAHAFMCVCMCVRVCVGGLSHPGGEPASVSALLLPWLVPPCAAGFVFLQHCPVPGDGFSQHSWSTLSSRPSLCTRPQKGFLSMLSSLPQWQTAGASYWVLASLVARVGGRGVLLSCPAFMLGRPCVPGSQGWEFFNDSACPSCGSQTASCLAQVLCGEGLPASPAALGAP